MCLADGHQDDCQGEAVGVFHLLLQMGLRGAAAPQSTETLTERNQIPRRSDGGPHATGDSEGFCLTPSLRHPMHQLDGPERPTPLQPRASNRSTHPTAAPINTRECSICASPAMRATKSCTEEVVRKSRRVDESRNF